MLSDVPNNDVIMQNTNGLMNLQYQGDWRDEFSIAAGQVPFAQQYLFRTFIGSYS